MLATDDSADRLVRARCLARRRHRGGGVLARVDRHGRTASRSARRGCMRPRGHHGDSQPAVLARYPATRDARTRGSGGGPRVLPRCWRVVEGARGTTRRCGCSRVDRHGRSGCDGGAIRSNDHRAHPLGSIRRRETRCESPLGGDRSRGWAGGAVLRDTEGSRAGRERPSCSTKGCARVGHPMAIRGPWLVWGSAWSSPRMAGAHARALPGRGRRRRSAPSGHLSGGPTTPS